MVEFWIQTSSSLILLLHFTAVAGQPAQLIVRFGDEVTLPCGNLISDEDRCERVQWIFYVAATLKTELFKNGQIVEQDIWMTYRAHRLSVIQNCSLLIEQVTDEDAGRYICTQIESGRGDSQVDLFVVTMTEDESDDEVTLSCFVLGYPWCDHGVEWLYEGKVKDGDPSHDWCSAFLTYKKQESKKYKSLNCEVTDLYTGQVQQFPFSPQTSADAATTTETTTMAATKMVPTKMAATKMVPTKMVATKMVPTKMAATKMVPTKMAATKMVPTKMAATKMAATKMVPTKMAATKMVPTKMVPTKMAATTMVPTKMAATKMAATKMAATKMVPTKMVPTKMVPTKMAATTSQEADAATTTETTTMAATMMVPTKMAATTKTSQEARADCSVLDCIMLVMRVAELLLITVITVLLIRARGNQRPPEHNTVSYSARRPRVMRSGAADSQVNTDEDEDDGVMVTYEN